MSSNDTELCFLSLADTSSMLRSKRLSPVELTDAVLRRIAKVDKRLNAFITVTAESALVQAKQAEREILDGQYRGPLHGIAVALKDLFYTRGIRTTAGSRILADFVPGHDAAVVERLRSAGAVIVGKNNMHEFAYGADNLNPHYGPTVNPWHVDHMSGGSSGGSAAAVAAGLCFAAVGSDTGGSIRTPAACCGVVGLKPTYGSVSRYGAVPLSWSQDTAGPIARTVEDAALILDVLAGYDERDPSSANTGNTGLADRLRADVRGLKLGVPREYFFARLEPEVRALVDQALLQIVRLGVELIEVRLPNMAEAAASGLTMLFAEASSYHYPWLRERPLDYGPDVRGRLEIGSMILATDYLHAQRARRLLCDQALAAFRQVDALAMPTMPIAAPLLHQTRVVVEQTDEEVRSALLRFTRPFNVFGWPALAMPCGFTKDGLPASLQLVSKPFSELFILQVGHAYEQATGWNKVHPDVQVTTNRDEPETRPGA